MKCPVRDILRICVILPFSTLSFRAKRRISETQGKETQRKENTKKDKKWMLPRFFTTLRSVLNDTQGKEEHTGKETQGKETQKKKNTRREQKKEILLTI